MKSERLQITLSVGALGQLKIISKKRGYDSERDFVKEMIRTTVNNTDRIERYGLSDEDYGQLIKESEKQHISVKDSVKKAIHFYLKKVVHLPHFL